MGAGVRVGGGGIRGWYWVGAGVRVGWGGGGGGANRYFS